MSLRPIKKLIHIEAPKETVWDVLLDLDSFRIWAKAFSPGSYAKTDWKEGSTALFLDPSGLGMVSRIVSHVPNDHITMEHVGVVVDGVEDYESEEAQQWRGGRESYFVSETDDITTLIVEADMLEAYYDDLDKQWDEAILIIKDLAEKKESPAL